MFGKHYVFTDSAVDECKYEKAGLAVCALTNCMETCILCMLFDFLLADVCLLLSKIFSLRLIK